MRKWIVLLILVITLTAFMSGMANATTGKTHDYGFNTSLDEELVFIHNVRVDNLEPPGGPYYHQIYSATSTDGISWIVNNTLLFDHASVPGAVYFNNKVYLYYVNAEDSEHEKLSVGISEDRGATFTVYDVHITGSNSPYPVDPNPIIDGEQIRLTYLGNFNQGETNKIVTALSSDGINFVEDEVIFTGDVYDPDLFYDEVGGEWVLFLNSGGLTKATSSSPSGPFTEDPDFSWTSGSISSTHKIGDKYYTYYAGIGGISVAEYANGNLSEIANGIVDGADPTVVLFGPNDCKMFFKTVVEGEQPSTVEFQFVRKIEVGGGVFPGIISANDHFYVSFEVDQCVYVKEYDENFTATGEHHQLTGNDVSVADHQMIFADNHFYLVHSVGPANNCLYLKKFDANWNEIKSVTVVENASENERTNDMLLSYADGFLYVGTFHAQPPNFGHYIKKYGTDLELVDEFALIDEKHINGASMLFVDDTFVIAASDNFWDDSSLIVMRYGVNWNYIDSKTISAVSDANERFPMGLLFENGRYFVSYTHQTGNISSPPPGEMPSDNGDIILKAFDSDWNLLAQTNVTDDIPPNMANRAHIALAGNRIYAAYDSTETGGYAIFIKEYTIITSSDYNQQPIANFSYSPLNPVVNQTITFNASDSTDPDGTITNYEWVFGNGNTTNTTEPIITQSYSSAAEYTINLTVTDDGGLSNLTSKTVTVNPAATAVFDTGPGTYPSIAGTHNGIITPSQTINISKLYTYPCAGTGGHTEYTKIWDNSWNVTANWGGYTGDWHNISFDPVFTLHASETYNYTIRTGSYPQIIHEHEYKNATGGTITCTSFVDVNGKTYTDWIPAIRLE